MRQNAFDWVIRGLSRVTASRATIRRPFFFLLPLVLFGEEKAVREIFGFPAVYTGVSLVISLMRISR